MTSAQSVKGTSLLLAAFFGLFLVVFIQFPLRGELPGNADTQLAIALSNQIWEKLILFFTHPGETWTAMFPARDVLAYGENCYGLAGLFLFFEALTRSEINGYYLFLTSIFALNAFAVTRLAENFVSRRSAWLAGLAFSLAGFTLGNVDDPNVVFVFFPVMGLAFAFRAVKESDAKALILAAFYSGVQIWFGFYLFVYQLLLLTLLFAVASSQIRALAKKGVVWKSLIAFTAPVFPLLVLYALNYEYAQITSPYEVFRDCSLSWDNFFHRLPENLIYPEGPRYLDWVEVRKNCFPGLLLPMFAVLGCGSWSRRLKQGEISRVGFVYWLLVFGLFFFLAFGANNPLLIGFHEIPILGYLRVPSRFYLVSLLGAAIFFSAGVESVAARLGSAHSKSWVRVFLTIIAFGYVLENVPTRLPGYDYASLIRPSNEYVETFAGSEPRRVILDLPSTIRFLPNQGVDTSARIWFFTREALYMNWQTYHRQIIVNGANGYVAKARADVDALVREVPSKESLRALKAIGVTHVVFHKDLVLFPDEDILVKLKAATELKKVKESDREAIFEIDI